jgi:hypothetical protein
LTTTPTKYMHVEIEIVDPSQQANLRFEQSLMDGQIYDDGSSEGKTKYDPVNIGKDDDTSLSVQLFSSPPKQETGRCC